MDLTRVFARSLKHIRDAKFLVVLGILIGLLSAEGSMGTVMMFMLRYLPEEVGFLTRLDPSWGLLPEPDIAGVLLPIFEAGWPGVVSILCGVSFMVVATGTIILLLYGAQIIGVGSLEKGESTGFKQSVKQSWKRLWALLVTASIPPVPITIATIITVIGLGLFIDITGGIETLPDTMSVPATAPLLIVGMVIINLPFLVITLFLMLLWPLAGRACLLENQPTVSAYKAAWKVLKSNFSDVLLIMLIQWALGTVFSTALLLPRVASVLCFAFIPLLWIIGGIERTFTSVLWTVAWHDWR